MRTGCSQTSATRMYPQGSVPGKGVYGSATGLKTLRTAIAAFAAPTGREQGSLLQNDVFYDELGGFGAAEAVDAESVEETRGARFGEILGQAVEGDGVDFRTAA